MAASPSSTMEASGPAEPTRKRLRTSHACDVCRARKIRCDGNTPCASCSVSEQECTYGSEANSRGKSDLILEGIMRIEKSLGELNSTIATPLPRDRRQALPTGSPALRASSASFTSSPLSDAHHSVQVHHQQPRTPISEPHNAHGAANGFENAILDSMHTSTTESVLQWPHFDYFPSLRNEYIPIFQLEQARPALKTRPNTVYPYVSAEGVDSILASFEHTINFWYPTMSRSQLSVTRDMVTSGVLDEDSPSTCLALLTMALGCASEVVAGLTGGAALVEDERKRRAARRELGAIYFDSALKRLYMAHMEVSSVATHCLFFAALYFAFLHRPLPAWEHMNAASAKCLLLLSYPPPLADTAEDQERIRRIFWACYILESDYLAELSALPQSGIARIESSVPLPGTYETHTTPSEEEQSSLYFLACISMRRLLNRVHQLLYARGSGASLDRARFPYVVAELNHQLDEWRDVLPATFSFSVDREATATEAGGFLRQRYLTCRSVIYRPYLMWMLSGSGGGDGISSVAPSQEAVKNCKTCLDACLLHILNLRGFSHTVLVDTWICSLSMAGAMLVLLAACRVPTLRALIEPGVLSAGFHLKQLLEEWQTAMGAPTSPSVDQSVRVIHEADRFISQVYA